MIHHPDWSKELDRLNELDNPQKRGYEFQAFVGTLFKNEHFLVTPSPRAALPRQVDLVATRGADAYLIETKWRKKPAGIDDVDSLFTRVESMPADFVGILVSYTGFTGPVVERVKDRSNRPILLLDGNEVEQVAKGQGLSGVLDRKKNQLTVHRTITFDPATRTRQRPTETDTGFPGTIENFTTEDGRRTKWIASGGGFGQFTFARDRPDIDWVPGPGTGVSVDLALSIGNESELLSLLNRLAGMGWVTADASWSIQQATRNWHGMGATSFCEVLPDWTNRYQGLDTHGSEELCYFDICDGGFYTLTASIAAYEPRWVRRCRLSFQLIGIPLDTGPFRELCKSFEVPEPVYFRPRDEPSLSRLHLYNDGPASVPVSYVVEVDRARDEDDGPEEWVVGVVVKNPEYGSLRSQDGWLPDIAMNSEYLVCDLRSWHPLSSPKATYRIWARESAWTSEALVLRVLADWDDEAPEPDHVLPTSGPAPNGVVEIVVVEPPAIE